MTRVLLHVGTHKTGTTSIQESLRVNRSFLARNNYDYPDGLGIFPSSPTTHHAFSHGLTGIDALALGKSLSYARALQRSAGTVIISAEPIYRHIHGYDGWQFDAVSDYWGRKRKYLETLREALGRNDIEVIIVFREREQFVESLFVELCRRKQWQEPFADFKKATQLLLDYDRQLQLLRQVFSKIDVLNYEEMLDSGGSVVGFWRHLGVECPAQHRDIWLRRTLSGQ